MTTFPQGSPSNPTKDIIIYITGFGPWSRIIDNPSSAISGSLLPAGSTIIRFTGSDGVNYNIHLHPHLEPVRVCYKDVDEFVEKLWEEGGFDYVLHLGLGHNGMYQLETQAHEEGYDYADVDGLDAHGNKGLERRPRVSTLDANNNEALTHPGVKDPEVKKEAEETEVYTTGLDVGYLTRFVEMHAKKPDGRKIKIVESDRAGLFLCEYIFRCSLKQAERRDKGPSKRVLFMHVCEAGMPYTIETGVDVVKTLVEGMVRDGEGLRLQDEQGYAGL